ncbi:MAG: hypothetical protein QGH33_12460, partial [Pirellulaceae bacterium]|nr:hypothetical protein [Pirellulaceae bacterium]
MTNLTTHLGRSACRLPPLNMLVLPVALAVVSTFFAALTHTSHADEASDGIQKAGEIQEAPITASDRDHWS